MVSVTFGQIWVLFSPQLTVTATRFSPQEGSVCLALLGRNGARQRLLISLAERKVAFYCFGVTLTGINPLCAVLLGKFPVLNTRYLCEWES